MCDQSGPIYTKVFEKEKKRSFIQQHFASQNIM